MKRESSPSKRSVRWRGSINLKMYIKQLDTVIKWIENDEANKDVILIQLEGIKAQMEMDLE